MGDFIGLLVPVIASLVLTPFVTSALSRGNLPPERPGRARLTVFLASFLAGASAARRSGIASWHGDVHCV